MHAIPFTHLYWELDHNNLAFPGVFHVVKGRLEVLNGVTFLAYPDVGRPTVEGHPCTPVLCGIVLTQSLVNVPHEVTTGSAILHVVSMYSAGWAEDKVKGVAQGFLQLFHDINVPIAPFV